MSRYFLAGNLWLMLAMLAFVGRTYERSEPTMYSLFGVGRWFEPGEYSTFVGALLAAALACFLLHWRSAVRPAD